MRAVYTDEAINIFIDLARKVGVQQACNELSYPSYPTGLKWVKNSGVTVPAAATARLSKLTEEALKIEDKYYLLNNLYAHYVKAAAQDNIIDLNLVRLTGGVRTLMESYKLVEGKLEEAVEIAVQEDSTFADMLKEFNNTPASIKE